MSPFPKNFHSTYFQVISVPSVPAGVFIPSRSGSYRFILSLANLVKNGINKSLTEIDALFFHPIQKWFNNRNFSHLLSLDQNNTDPDTFRLSDSATFRPCCSDYTAWMLIQFSCGTSITPSRFLAYPEISHGPRPLE